MNKIVFDDIHTQDKQQRLKAMMAKVAAETLELPNDNPRLATCPVCNSPSITFTFSSTAMISIVANPAGIYSLTLCPLRFSSITITTVI